MAKPIRTVACVVCVLLLLPIAVGANDPYPSVGALVDALVKEFGWPAAPTMEEKILELRAEKVIPAYLTQTHLATPTVVMAMTQGLLQRSRAKGDDVGMVMSAMVRAAAASNAPIPTLQPEHIFLPPVSTMPPAALQEPEVSQPPSVTPTYPFVGVPPGVENRRVPRKTEQDGPRKSPAQEFPRSIFEPGESPAEQGAGVFRRQ